MAEAICIKDNEKKFNVILPKDRAIFMGIVANGVIYMDSSKINTRQEREDWNRKNKQYGQPTRTFWQELDEKIKVIGKSLRRTFLKKSGLWDYIHCYSCHELLPEPDINKPKQLCDWCEEHKDENIVKEHIKAKDEERARIQCKQS